ncbi:MAG: hypothetical protein HKN47_06335 [Pirellulaceae bacterium]|nr:hypothetical protein [Pirellulaceae bacterium]
MLICLGCSKSDVNQTAAATSARPVSANQSASISPTDVVSQFLDQVRRGGADSGAGNFLTAKAQSELARIGRSVQPIGSPDAKFEVTRAEPIPGEDNAMLVHSIWTEPIPDGSTTAFQVVWAVQLEKAGWRISGLAMELQPGTDPTVIDFENGAMMAKLLADETPANSANPTQAATPSQGLNR